MSAAAEVVHAAADSYARCLSGVLGAIYPTGSTSLSSQRSCWDSQSDQLTRACLLAPQFLNILSWQVVK